MLIEYVIYKYVYIHAYTQTHTNTHTESVQLIRVLRLIRVATRRTVNAGVRHGQRMRVSLRGNGVGGIKGGDQPRPLARPRPLHKGLGWREAQAQNVVADIARGLRGARGLEAGQLLRVKGRGVRERGRESEGEVNGEGERVKIIVKVKVTVR